MMPLDLLADVAPAPLDPYWVWASLTDYRDYLAAGAPRTVAVAIECRDSVAALEASIAAANLAVVISPLYTTTLSAGGVVDPAVARFCTATLAVDDVPHLLQLVTRLELGTAIETGTAAPVLPDSSKLAKPVARKTATPVVGVIDDFVAFGHPCFEGLGHEKGRSRVRYVWSQEATLPPAVDNSQWYTAKDLGYGHELTSLSRGGKPAPKLARLRLAYPPVLARSLHGTPIAYLAAGNGPRLESSGADIVAVHLPKRMVADTSGGGLSVHALDGIRYVVQRAGELSPTVVNLSYGTMAGPHDGTSILEEAIDELIDLRKGKLAVVLPAGNAYEARGHAAIELSAREPTARLNWVVPPDCQTPSFMEVWLPAGAASNIGITVSDPAGRRVKIERADDVRGDGQRWNECTFGVVYLPQVANGKTGTMILIALAPTASIAPSARVLARHGEWRVDLHTRSRTNVYEIHAWIERNDTLFGHPQRGRQSYLVDPNYERAGNKPGQPDDNALSLVRRRGSFNTIGSGRNTIVAGGFVGEAEDALVALESGSGPLRPNAHRRHGPEVLARTEESRALHGIRAAANGPVDTVRISGTSVAGPQVARKIAVWYSETSALTPVRIREKLLEVAQKTREDPYRRGAGSLPLPEERAVVRPALTSETAVPAATDTAPDRRPRSRAPNPSSTDSPSPANTPAGSPSPDA
jgi:hypothetical protein